MKNFFSTIFLIFAVVLFIAGNANADDERSVKALEKQMDNVQEKNLASRVTVLDAVSTMAVQLSKKIELARKDLVSNDPGNVNLEIQPSGSADIEKMRARLKSDIKEWLMMIDYVEVVELKKGISDGLAVAEADGLDIEKLTTLYNHTKDFVRNTSFREAETSIDKRLRNLDLDRDATDERLKQLAAKRESLKAEIEVALANIDPRILNPLTKMKAQMELDSLSMELIGVEFEVLQHLLNVRHEDISQPLYIAMDGVLSGIVTLTRFTEEGRQALKISGLADHEFDFAAVREMAERYSLKLVTLGFMGEELAAEARAKRQTFRLGLYKHAAIAFIRALISGKDRPEQCAPAAGTEVLIDIGGEKVRSLGCPDPVVKNLRAYMEPFRKFQSAEADIFIAEGEKLISEQQVIADFMAAVPVVGDVLDAYSFYSGENLAGVDLSPLERAFTGALLAIPVVGPNALNQLDRFPELKAKMASLKGYFEAMGSVATDVDGALRTMKDDVADRFFAAAARKLDVEADQLKRMVGFLKEEAPYVLDDAARARMSLYKTMRDAAEDRLWLEELKKTHPELYKRMLQDSDDILSGNLLARQPGVEERIARTHMVPEHLEGIAGYAKESDRVILFRPIEEPAGKVLKSNPKVQTKPLSMKAKSSNWDAASGYIPVEQKFSKLGNPRDPDFPANAGKVSKFDQYGRKCLKQKPPCALSVHLKIDSADAGQIEAFVVKNADDKFERSLFRNSEGQWLDPETAMPLSPEALARFDVSEPRPLMVFADPKTGMPYTADYDLLAAAGKGRHISPHYHPTKGFMTEDLEDVLDGINESAHRTGHQDMSHHGPDTFNPGTEGIDYSAKKGKVVAVADPERGILILEECDRSCLQSWCSTTHLCDPTKICDEPPVIGCLLVDKDRLAKDYFHDMRLRGYNLDPHSLWGWGGYNELSGWTLNSFLGAPTEAVETASEPLFNLLKKVWQEKINISLFGRYHAPLTAPKETAAPQ